MEQEFEKKANALIRESSPYLLQHAYNPVDWLPYGPEAFEKAKRENKLVLISIGYSACHWCHVMEKESFEDTEVAELMNRYFVSIKVDREERSDVDMLYMQAVQLMSGHGGWPLNCFALPNGQPFYGGTYFRPEQWKHVLQTLANMERDEPDKIRRYAAELSKGIAESERLISSKNGQDFGKKELRDAVEKWKQNFDRENGGMRRAPKFPMPSNYLFLLRYAELADDTELRDLVFLTLDKMALGGIYDQIRGGFARYSTDMIWKVPHFEKMLYDNAQLVSLYCEAFRLSGRTLYRDVVMETLDFVSREWTGPESCFYSAYDADSDGVEGKYYVWQEDELREALGEDYAFFARCYRIDGTGYWEHENYILMRSEQDAGLLAESSMSIEDFKARLNTCRAVLRREAEKRNKPGLDDKSICAWNAMMSSAFAQAWLSFGEAKHKTMALSSLDFLMKSMRNDKGRLFRTYKKGQAKIPAFLDDYAFCIEALIQGYCVSQNENYLEEAKKLCEIALQDFDQADSPLLYYTSLKGDQLISRSTDHSDNVVPASNSQMALNLFYLSRYFAIPEWERRAVRMLATVSDELLHYPSAYSHWAILALHFLYPFFEIAIVGKDVDEKLKALYKQGLTNAILAPGRLRSELPLFKDRYQEGKTLIYVCRNSVCGLPVEDAESALAQLETN
ncbi:MAG TPA: thioredoxin domain-containing protein [Bacteroidia bacterium]|nr:thioredoxin domain-containing protein [Bacteroidia bacterium]